MSRAVVRGGVPVAAAITARSLAVRTSPPRPHPPLFVPAPRSGGAPAPPLGAGTSFWPFSGHSHVGCAHGAEPDDSESGRCCQRGRCFPVTTPTVTANCFSKGPAGLQECMPDTSGCAAARCVCHCDCVRDVASVCHCQCVLKSVVYCVC
jgi:hypothetical protein